MKDCSVFKEELSARSEGRCELCGGNENLDAVLVTPTDAAAAERCVLVCAACESQVAGRSEIDSKHWYCLRESIWSEVAAVQVVGYRMLKRLQAEGWAQDLLGQVYLSDEVQAWADADTTGATGGEISERVITLDSNGAELVEGDSVTLIKDLDVKGAGFVAKRGTMVRNIHLIDDADNIEGRINKMTLVLKTKFLKRA